MEATSEFSKYGVCLRRTPDGLKELIVLGFKDDGSAVEVMHHFDEAMLWMDFMACAGSNERGGL